MGKLQRNTATALGFLVVLGCAEQELPSVQYASEQCRRVALVDAVSGNELRGVEDIEIDRQTGRLFLSAYDRRAVEKAARKRASTLPQGGIYSVSIDQLFDANDQSIGVTSMVSPDDIGGGLRPHGLSYDASNDELVFINRTYQRINDRWIETPRLQRIGANGEVFVGTVEDSPCAANDVLVTEQQIFTSFDHGACNWREPLEDVFNLKRSGLTSNHSGAVFNEAAFANGLTRTQGGNIVLAATRENALLLMAERSNGVETISRIDVPGGPDNLSISYDGGVVAATHQNLIRLMFNRKLGLGKAPSRIVKANPETGAVDVLMDDPSGKLFSAATIAVESKRGLVAGSVTDKGVLVCDAAS